MMMMREQQRGVDLYSFGGHFLDVLRYFQPVLKTARIFLGRDGAVTLIWGDRHCVFITVYTDGKIWGQNPYGEDSPADPNDMTLYALTMIGHIRNVEAPAIPRVRKPRPEQQLVQEVKPEQQLAAV